MTKDRPESAQRPLNQRPTIAMSTKLDPAEPPGRRTRKARGYSTEIRQLRARGYTFEAIRAALAAVGVDVSNRTVQREAGKLRDVHARETDAAGATQEVGRSCRRPYGTDVAARAELSQSPSPQPAEHRRGKDVAEEFRRSQCVNPLIRVKEQS